MSSKDDKIVGSRWRILARMNDRSFEAQDQGVFDELVVDDWLHIEQLDARVWWMRIGDARVRVEVSQDGRPTIDVERGTYAQIRGE